VVGVATHARSEGADGVVSGGRSAGADPTAEGEAEDGSDQLGLWRVLQVSRSDGAGDHGTAPSVHARRRRCLRAPTEALGVVNVMCWCEELASPSDSGRLGGRKKPF
jgi:hypothetical protein